MEAAVAQHFAQQAADTQPAEEPASPGTRLRSVIGPNASDAQIAELIRSAAGSIEGAADLFFAEGLPAVGGADDTVPR